MKKVTDEVIIRALLENETQAAAAKSIGITPQTIINRMKKPSFVQKYHDTQNEILRATTRKLSNACGKSAELMINTLKDEDMPIVLRLNIAKDILRMSRDFITVDELQRRLSQLEYEQLTQTEDSNTHEKDNSINRFREID